MRSHKSKIILASIGLLVVVVIIGALVRRQGGTTTVQSQEVYYCPMHPTYISDRPGDCPICNMKLVKKEAPPAVSPSTGHSEHSQKTKDICYLHNCPHLKEGKLCPMLVVAKEGEKVSCPICGTHIKEGVVSKKEKKILFWTDPMIPGYKSDKPGKSPMGMDMVPVYEEDDVLTMESAAPEGYAPILLTPQKQQLIGIKTSPVEKKTLTKVIRTVGTIAHDPELYQAQTEYIQTIKSLERAKQSNIPEVVDQAQRLVESTQLRLKHMGLNDELIAETATRQEAEHSFLIAHPGQSVWVYAHIYEYELPLVKVGQELRVEVPSIPEEFFAGKIRAIDPMVDAMTRTTRVRAQVEDPKGFLKPDMYVNAVVQIDLGEKLALPIEAVFDTGTKKIVFVDKGQGVLEPRDVVVGAKTANDYALISGVQEGESVVTNGNFLIDSESRLKAALEGMTQTGTAPAEGEQQHGSHGGH